MTSAGSRPTLRTRLENTIDRHSVRFGAWLLRATRGRVTRLWRRRALVLTTRGRRSGRPRTVVVQWFPDGEAFVVIAANSGMPTHPAWYLNITDDPLARVEVDGRSVDVRAEELSAEEAAQWWPRILNEAPDCGRYSQRTGRSIPLLRLVPLERPVQNDVATGTSAPH